MSKMNGRGANKNSQEYTDAISEILSQGQGKKINGMKGASSQQRLGSSAL